ncbi:MAG: ubiquinone/menaquinone biosynthesis methyltransferase [Chthoniobacterales bacterium]
MSTIFTLGLQPGLQAINFPIEKKLRQQDPEFVRGTFAAIASRYDLANHLLSGGMDFLWRARVAKIVQGWNAKRILDLATGSGDLALTMQKKCPEMHIVAADFCLPMLAKALEKGMLDVVHADAMQLPFKDGMFDGVTVAFGLRNMKSWSGALREMARVIKPGGHLLILDFSLPAPGLMRSFYRFYLHRILPVIAGLVTGDKGAYDYLGESIEQFPHGEAMAQMIDENNFQHACAQALTLGIVSIYTATRRTA